MSNNKRRKASVLARQTINQASMPPIAMAPPLALDPTNAPRFEELRQMNILNPILLSTITNDLKFDKMMPVQAAALPELLRNNSDCLAQAKTGTGKTLAFLLPAIQKLLSTPRTDSSAGQISCLVLAPTRELALQIAEEAKALLRNFPAYRVGVAIGGTNKNTEYKMMMKGCEICVATPGRLLDHLQEAGIAARLSGLQTFVLDEADRMVDIGFLPAIKQITSHLPSKTAVPRQSMMFSATVPPRVQEVAHTVLNRGYKVISTIQPGDTNTHERVPQHLIVAPSMSLLAPAMVAAVRAERAAANPFKAIIFVPTAAMADFYIQLLANVNGLPIVSALHARLSQSRRTKITDDFRKARDAICIATDVIARGMDFPGVTHIFQIGLPSDPESYVHRLGRTARAEADGRGILILTAAESFFPRTIKGVVFESYPKIEYSISDISDALDRVEKKDKVYQAWLGFYKSHVKALRWTNDDLVREANTFAADGLQCDETPGLEKGTISKMGLKGVPGLRVIPNAPRQNAPRGAGAGRRSVPPATTKSAQPQQSGSSRPSSSRFSDTKSKYA